MKLIEFERFLIDLEGAILNNSLENIEIILNNVKPHYVEATKMLDKEENKENIIYLTSLITKYNLLNSFLDVISDRKREEIIGQVEGQR